jgi:hypothetical protein
MEHVPHVLLLGNSILMDGLAESLQMQQPSTVTRVNAAIQEIDQHLSSIHPDLIIYELNHSAANPVFSLLIEHNEVSHLAIDQKNKQIFLYYCKTEPTGSMKDLCDFVSTEVAFKLRKTVKTHTLNGRCRTVGIVEKTGE